MKISSLMICVALALLTATVPARAASTELAPAGLHRGGMLSLWKTHACADGAGLCGLPEAIGAPVRIEVGYEQPVAPGKYRVADRVFLIDTYRVRLLQVWNELEKPAISYLMTQLELTRVANAADGTSQAKLLAVCSRYDGTDAFTTLPPGACSGTEVTAAGEQVIGMSISQ